MLQWIVERVNGRANAPETPDRLGARSTRISGVVRPGKFQRREFARAMSFGTRRRQKELTTEGPVLQAARLPAEAAITSASS